MYVGMLAPHTHATTRTPQVLCIRVARMASRQKAGPNISYNCPRRRYINRALPLSSVAVRIRCAESHLIVVLFLQAARFDRMRSKLVGAVSPQALAKDVTEKLKRIQRQVIGHRG